MVPSQADLVAVCPHIRQLRIHVGLYMPHGVIRPVYTPQSFAEAQPLGGQICDSQNPGLLATGTFSSQAHNLWEV